MAERFNLTAQINLQAPNTKDVANKIRNDLNGIKASVDIKADPKALAAVTGQVQQIDKGAKTASRSVGLLNRNLTEAARRFSVITVATGTFISLARAIKTSVKDAIEFERELVRISQVTGKSVSQLTGLSQEVTRLATTLGVANASLLQTSRILAQAGLSAQKTQQALQVLANTTLAPSFDNIIDTTEGAIAILNQFGRAAAKTGNDIQFLEQSLDAINQVSKNFAVESADLISAVRRTGGVFQAAGGNINELIALFTSVRQTTRESAETIATGFRTIFTRLQRKDTLDALKELGIVLQDVEGNFVGPLKAIEALSVGLAVLDPKDVRFNEIVEQLGGFRQIGKVIPLLKQYAVTQQALAVANNASGSTAKDAQTAQQSLAVQFQKTREQFDALIRKFSQSDTFQDLAKTILRLAGAFLKVVESLETVLPLLASVAAIKIGKGLAPGVAGLVGGAQRRNSGGKILGFNRGGSVPGTGNRDTVPAMLTPGEFVIRKSSVQSIGAENLARMNNNKFNRGTTGRGVEEGRKIKDNRSPLRYGINTVVGQITPSGQQVTAKDTTLDTTLGRLRKSSGKNLQPNYDDQQKVVLAGKVSSLSLNKEDGESVFSEKAIVDPILNSGQRRIQKQINAIDGRLKVKNSLANDRNARNTIAGFAFESFVSGLSSVAAGGDQAPFDFVGAQTGRLSRFAEKEPIPAYLDAKRSKKDESVILRKALNEKTLAASARPFFRGGAVQKFATGGIVSQKAAGAAILDNIGPSKTAQVPISTQEVKNKFPEFRGLAKGKDPVSQFYKKTNFKVTKSGLDQSTSDKFKIALEDGLVAGVNFATDRLSADLGTPNAKIDPGQTSNFVKSINTSIFGRLFESSVDAIARQGDFSKPDTDTSRPFDAEGGLPGSLRDNFEGLPPRYIDLKSSLAAASDANLKGKVLDQVKRELTAQGILNVDYPGKEGRDKERQRRTGLTGEQTANKAISGAGFPVKRATGGGISGQDTVPALLTPGEFVFSKSAAQSIGYGTLNRMNVKGYNKGGVVQRFANGGGVSGAGDTGSGGNDPLTQIFGQIQSLVPSLIKALKNFIASTDRFAGSVSILANVVKGSIGSINALKAETEQSTKQSDQTEKSDKDLEKSNEKLKQKRDAQVKSAEKVIKAELVSAKSSDGPGAKRGGKLKAAESKSVKVIRGVGNTLNSVTNKVSGAFNSVATAAIGLTFILGSLVETFSAASDAEKEQTQAGIANVSAFAAVATQVISFGAALAGQVIGFATSTASLAVNTAFRLLNSKATLLETAASIKNTIAKTKEALASIGVTAALAPLAPIGAAVGVALAALLLPIAAVAAALTTAAVAIGAVATGSFAVGLGTVLFEAGRAVKKLDQDIKKFGENSEKILKQLEDDAKIGSVSESDFVENQVGGAVADFRKAVIKTTQLQVAYNNGIDKASAAVDATENQFFTFRRAIAGFAISPVAGIVGLFGFTVEKVAGSVDAAKKEILNFDKSLQQARDAISAALDEYREQERVIASASASYASATFQATKAVADFSRSLKEAEKINLDAAGTTNRLVDGFDTLLGVVRTNEGTIESADKELAKLAPELVEKGLISGGSVVSEGRQSQIFSNLSAEEAQQLGAVLETFKVITEQRTQAVDRTNKALEQALKIEAELRQNQIKVIAEAFAKIEKDARELGTTNLAEITANALQAASFVPSGSSGERTASGILQQLPAATENAFRNAQKKIEEAIQEEFRVRIKSAKELGDTVKQAVIESQRDDRIAIARKQSAKDILEQARGIQIANRTRLASIRSQLLQAQALEKGNIVLRGFNEALLGATNTAFNFANLDNLIAGVTGGEVQAGGFDQNIQALEIGLANPGQIGDAFKTALAEAELALGGAIPGVTGDILDTVSLSQDLGRAIEKTFLSTSGGAVAGTFVRQQASGETRAQAGERIFDELKKNLGDPSIPQEIQDVLRASIEESLGDGTEQISLEEFTSNLTESLDGPLQLYGEALKKALEVQSEYVAKLSQINQAIVAAEQRVLDAGVAVEQVRQRNADRIFQAQNPGQRRSRAAREAGRVATAEAALGTAARVRGARAGDVGATAAALKKLREQAAQAAEQAKTGNAEQRAAAANRANRLNQAADQTAKELERLANQAGRAADIEKDLSDLRARQASISTLQENIAFGTDDQRRQINEDFRNLRAAINQGDLRGATGEQRQSVARGLDALGDNIITGLDKGIFGQDALKASEVKAIIAARETGRIGAGGVNQFLENLRAAENPLLADLEVLAEQELLAAQALQRDANNQVGLLTEIKKKLVDDFAADIVKAFKDAEGGAQGDRQQRQQEIDDLNDKIGILDTNITSLNTQIADLNTSIKQLQESLENQRKVERELDNDTERQQIIEQGKNLKQLSDLIEASTKASEKDTVNLAKLTGNLPGFGRDVQVTRQGAGGTFEVNPEIAKAQKALIQERARLQAQLREVQTDRPANFEVEQERLLAGIKLNIARQKKLDEIQTRGSVSAETTNKDIAAIVDKIGINDLNITNQGLTDAIKANTAELNKRSQEIVDENKKSTNLARGGLVYRQEGGSIFQPRGTDTVPAMLTPGEFVMNRTAVQKYGVNFMRNLNRGNLAGFNNGGFVGLSSEAILGRRRGSRRRGGSISQMTAPIDRLELILNKFSDSFRNSIDNMVSRLSSSVEQMAQLFDRGMTINHQFSGDMTLAFDIQNGDVLKEQIAQAITPKLQEIISTELNRRLDNNNFRSGG